jgi:hypothetical protein
VPEFTCDGGPLAMNMADFVSDVRAALSIAVLISKSRTVIRGIAW